VGRGEGGLEDKGVFIETLGFSKIARKGMGAAKLNVRFGIRRRNGDGVREDGLDGGREGGGEGAKAA